jgi:acyl-CoA reductase-like NAD-dependent aldehyde dehydrogenase
MSGRNPPGVFVRHPDKVWIGGEWLVPSTGRLIELISPNTEQVVAEVAEAGEEDMDAAVAAAREAFDHGPWPRMTPAERSAILSRVTEHLRTRDRELALAWTAQMGGLGSYAPAMIETVTNQFDRIRQLGADFQYIEQRDTYATKTAYVIHEPVGVVACITPWNGPYGIMSAKVGNALIAGCTVIMKPATETPLDAYIIAEACEAAGIPRGVVNLVCGDRQASERLIFNPGVDKVSFTGSLDAGKRIGSICGERVGRCMLELGGKSAAILRDDFSTQQAAEVMTRTISVLSGQVCAMLSRLIVPRRRHDEVVDAIAAEMKRVRIGYSDDPETQLGPLAMKRQLERVETYVGIGQDEADLAYGGSRPSQFNRGYFMEPTLFANAGARSRIAQEEIFGPVLTVIPVEDEAEAIQVANDSRYGLFGSILTHDAQAAYNIGRQVRTGGMSQGGLKNDWDMPFGGFKQSGIGREGGVDGLLAYLEKKTLYIEDSVDAW